MKALLISASIAAVLLNSVTSYAQAPAAAPAGSTGLCKDGTYYSGTTKSGACAKHNGVKEWFGATAAAPAAGAAAAAASATPASAKAAVPAATPAASSTATTNASAPAAGGGPGQVWVNTSTKVYHCQNTKYYGKTKLGTYMTEADAKSKGNHADHGKACSK